VARRFDLFLVNSVVDSSGPEYLRRRQIIRAGLERSFLASFRPADGCDVCYTTAAADDSADNLLIPLTAAGQLLHGSSCSDDGMLNYQSTVFAMRWSREGCFTVACPGFWRGWKRWVFIGTTNRQPSARPRGGNLCKVWRRLSRPSRRRLSQVGGRRSEWRTPRTTSRSFPIR
jgi:hypothetical protein